MTPAAHQILAHLAAYPGEDTAAQLSSELHIEPAEVARALPALRRAGLVEPAVYRVSPTYTGKVPYAGTPGDIIEALQSCPLPGVEIAAAVSRLRLERDEPPIAWARTLREALDLLVCLGDVIPPSHPVPTAAGLRLALSDLATVARVVEAEHDAAACVAALRARRSARVARC